MAARISDVKNPREYCQICGKEVKLQKDVFYVDQFGGHIHEKCMDQPWLRDLEREYRKRVGFAIISFLLMLLVLAFIFGDPFICGLTLYLICKG